MSRVVIFVDAGYLFKAGGQLLAAREVRREEVVLNAEAAMKVLTDTGCALASRELLGFIGMTQLSGRPESSTAI